MPEPPPVMRMVLPVCFIEIYASMNHDNDNGRIAGVGAGDVATD
jgi:hypothetical protein